MYIDELPLNARFVLCDTLNKDESWIQLGGHMQFDKYTIDNLRKENDPADQLLRLWGRFNHKVIELFALLRRLKLCECLLILKPYIDEKYHKFILPFQKTENITESDKDKIKVRVPFDEDDKNKVQGEEIVSLNNDQTQPFTYESYHDIIFNTKLVSSNVNDSMLSSKLANVNLLDSCLRQKELEDKFSRFRTLTDLLASENINQIALPRASYKELESITNNWDKSFVLGKGGFGCVYKAAWKDTLVAIKRIECNKFSHNKAQVERWKQLTREVAILSSRVHENILLLYAYCIGDKIPCLVYQFMANGSLKQKLLMKNSKIPLSWLQRHHIATGVARGLLYLHSISEKPLIHTDIKSDNILLDKDFNAKIGDFGLASEGRHDDIIIVNRTVGTYPYLPPEYLNDKKFSTKVDVFSYGVVLYEMATGLLAYDSSRNPGKLLWKYIQSLPEDQLICLADKNPSEDYNTVFYNLIMLGKLCCNIELLFRPNMEIVFRALNKVSAALEC